MRIYSSPGSRGWEPFKPVFFPSQVRLQEYKVSAAAATLHLAGYGVEYKKKKKKKNYYYYYYYYYYYFNINTIIIKVLHGTRICVYGRFRYTYPSTRKWW